MSQILEYLWCNLMHLNFLLQEKVGDPLYLVLINNLESIFIIPIFVKQRGPHFTLLIQHEIPSIRHMSTLLFLHLFLFLVFGLVFFILIFALFEFE